MCKPREPQEIANGVVKLLQDDRLRIELGIKAREKVLLNFTTDKSVNAYYESYQKLLNNDKEILKNNVSVESVLELVEYLKRREYEYAH